MRANIAQVDAFSLPIAKAAIDGEGFVQKASRAGEIPVIGNEVAQIIESPRLEAPIPGFARKRQRRLDERFGGHRFTEPEIHAAGRHQGPCPHIPGRRSIVLLQRS